MPKTLKLVEPVVEPAAEDKVAGYEPLFLSSPELLNRYWLQAAEALAPCVDKAMHGEMTLDDIYNGVVAGQMFCLVFKNDNRELPDVALALVLEIIAYPQFKAMNITALGGRELGSLRTKYWKHICSWAYMNGVRTLQASASPAMARMLKPYGFEPVYQTLRMSLTEM